MSLRRFIAGAQCPQCQKLDKIYITVEEGEDVAYCVACDYRSVRPKENDPVEPSQEETPLSETGVVKIIPR